MWRHTHNPPDITAISHPSAHQTDPPHHHLRLAIFGVTMLLFRAASRRMHVSLPTSWLLSGSMMWAAISFSPECTRRNLIPTPIFGDPITRSSPQISWSLHDRPLEWWRKPTSTTNWAGGMFRGGRDMTRKGSGRCCAYLCWLGVDRQWISATWRSYEELWI